MITKGLGSTLILRGFAHFILKKIIRRNVGLKEELGERRGHIYFGHIYNLGHSLEKYTLGKVK